MATASKYASTSTLALIVEGTFMKKSVLLTLVAVMLASSLFAKEKSFPAIRKIIDLVELDSTFIDEFVSGMHPHVVVACKEGTALPLRFLHRWPLFSLKYVPNLTLKVEESCYLRCFGKRTYLSLDLITWEKADRVLAGVPSVHMKIDAHSGVSIESSID
jgi:hypothetical protein